jgi:hypothetical protein
VNTNNLLISSSGALDFNQISQLNKSGSGELHAKSENAKGEATACGEPVASVAAKGGFEIDYKSMLNGGLGWRKFFEKFFSIILYFKRVF